MPEALVTLAVVVLYPLAISSYFLPMAGENLPGPRLLVPMLPFACLALAWVVDHPRRWLRVAFAVSLVYGVALSFLFVALGVRIYHTYPALPADRPLLAAHQQRRYRSPEEWRDAAEPAHADSRVPFRHRVLVPAAGPERLDDPRRARARLAPTASPRPASRHRAQCWRGSRDAGGRSLAGYGRRLAVTQVRAPVSISYQSPSTFLVVNAWAPLLLIYSHTFAASSSPRT